MSNKLTKNDVAKKLLAFTAKHHKLESSAFFGIKFSIVNKKMYLTALPVSKDSLVDGVETSIALGKVERFIRDFLEDLEVQGILRVHFKVKALKRVATERIEKEVSEQENSFDDIVFDDDVVELPDEEVDVEVIEEVKPVPLIDQLSPVIFIPEEDPAKPKLFHHTVKVLVRDKLFTYMRNVMNSVDLHVAVSDLKPLDHTYLVIKSEVGVVKSFEIEHEGQLIDAGLSYKTKLALINYINRHFFKNFYLPETEIPEMLKRLMFEGNNVGNSSILRLAINPKFTAVFKKHRLSVINGTFGKMDGQTYSDIISKAFIENLTEVANTNFAFLPEQQLMKDKSQSECQHIQHVLPKMKRLNRNREVVVKTLSNIVFDDRYSVSDLVLIDNDRLSELQARQRLMAFNKDLYDALTELLNEYVMKCDFYSYVEHFNTIDANRKNAK